MSGWYHLIDGEIVPIDFAEMREQIAKVAWDAYTGYITSIPWEQAGYKRQGHLRIADAVIAAITDVPVAE